MFLILTTESFDFLLHFEPKESALPYESGEGERDGGTGQGAGRTREHPALFKHPRCMINKEMAEKCPQF